MLVSREKTAREEPRSHSFPQNIQLPLLCSPGLPETPSELQQVSSIPAFDIARLRGLSASDRNMWPFTN